MVLEERRCGKDFPRFDKMSPTSIFLWECSCEQSEKLSKNAVFRLVSLAVSTKVCKPYTHLKDIMTGFQKSIGLWVSDIILTSKIVATCKVQSPGKVSLNGSFP